uniref:Uncharacterized protein n=1 Tax=viral metagenome TaxID=1070528 RepID=A0A6M3KTV0_9ZZZZ
MAKQQWKDPNSGITYEDRPWWAAISETLGGIGQSFRGLSPNWAAMQQQTPFRDIGAGYNYLQENYPWMVQSPLQWFQGGQQAQPQQGGGTQGDRSQLGPTPFKPTNLTGTFGESVMRKQEIIDSISKVISTSGMTQQQYNKIFTTMAANSMAVNEPTSLNDFSEPELAKLYTDLASQVSENQSMDQYKSYWNIRTNWLPQQEQQYQKQLPQFTREIGSVLKGMEKDINKYLGKDINEVMEAALVPVQTGNPEYPTLAPAANIRENNWWGNLNNAIQVAKERAMESESAALAEWMPDLQAQFMKTSFAAEREGRGGVIDTGVGFADWARRQPDFEQRKTAYATRMIASHPTLYPRYLKYLESNMDDLSLGQRSFQKWVEADPLLSSFKEREQITPATRQPRWASVRE